MIIACVNCDKKFKVNSELIPSNGRTIKCGSCHHVWFFKKENYNFSEIKETVVFEETPKTNKIKAKDNLDPSKKIENKNIQSSQIVKYEAKSIFTFSKLLSYIIVIIVSFIGLIIILDTFKSPLYNLLPGLEVLHFSFFETLKDIILFVKDLY